MKNSLPAKFAVLALVIAGTGVLGISYYSFRDAGSLLRAQSVQRLAENLNRDALLFMERMERMRSDLTTIKHSDPVSGFIRADQGGGFDDQRNMTIDLWKQRLEMDFSSLLHQRPEYDQIRFIGISGNGREIVRVDRREGIVMVIPEEGLQEKGKRGYFKKTIVLKPDQQYVSNIELNREHGNVVFPLQPVVRTAMPIYSASGSRFGIIIINANFEKLVKTLETPPDNVKYFLANEKGDYLFHPERGKRFTLELGGDAGMTKDYPDIHLNPADLKKNKFMTFDLPGETATLIVQPMYFDPLNKDRLATLSALASHSVIEEESAGFGRRLLIGVFAVVGILFIGMVIMAQRLMSPIKMLTAAADGITEGKKDVSVPVIERSDELGVLANSFSTMLKRLERSRNELHTLAQSLEQKVEDRTKELSVFKTTLDRTQDCIFMFRPDTLKYYYVNQGAMDQVGYSEEELFEMNPIDISPDFDDEGFHNIIQPLIDDPLRSITYETIHQHRNGRVIPVEISLQYIAPSGEEPRFVSIVRDITERKKVDRAKSEFVSTVSHELRTPLTSIKGSLGLVKAGAVGKLPDKLKSMLEIAYSNSDRLVLLINDILDIEKIEAGMLEIHLQPTDILRLVEEAIAANKGYGDEHGVTFVRTGISDPALVDGDRDRLMQVLSNLMSNAAKYSPNGDSVEILVTRQDSFVRIAVKDNGPGIPEEFQDHIFEKFSQADSSDTRQKGGTGLGLSITKAIVEQHGGTIGFESEIGKGTTFYIDLPEEDDRRKEGRNENSEDGSSQIIRNDHRRILICEDDADIATLLEIMLKNEGLNTNVARTALQAKQLLKDEDFDAMTLDLGLPDQDGISLMQELRGNPETHDLPIIVVSATAKQAKQEQNGNAIHVIDWIEKPIDPALLVDRLDKALKQPSGARPRILHVEDDKSIIKIVSTLVADTADIVAVMTIDGARNVLESETFDLVILDLKLPDGDGEELLPLFSKPGHPATPVIVFSAKDVSKEKSKTIQAALVKTQTTNEILLNTICSAIERRQSTS